jgi:4-diphosphocytidyl-2-C-methyl-D-erythritol kinase
MALIRLLAHAKVNLALALASPEPQGSRRAGWHRICTWMHAIDLADEVLIEPITRPLGHATSTWSARWAPDAPRQGLIDWPVERDLAWRALRAVETHVGRPLPTRIVLIKRIPTGAGLGGGSADAGAALLGVDRAWDLRLGLDTLRQLGATLGSDVPFFLDHQTPALPAIVSGFGETIERTARASGTLVLMMPPFGCPTAQVYRAFDDLLDHGRLGPLRAGLVRELADGAGADDGRLFNDLAAPACAVRPELGRLRAAAAEILGRPVHITGSGSAMFAVASYDRAVSLAHAVREALPGLAVCATRLV